jgi:hypothetical protein
LPNNNERCYSNFSTTFREVNTPLLYKEACMLCHVRLGIGVVLGSGLAFTSGRWPHTEPRQTCERAYLRGLVLSQTSPVSSTVSHRILCATSDLLLKYLDVIVATYNRRCMKHLRKRLKFFENHGKHMEHSDETLRNIRMKYLKTFETYVYNIHVYATS